MNLGSRRLLVGWCLGSWSWGLALRAVLFSSFWAALGPWVAGWSCVGSEGSCLVSDGWIDHAIAAATNPMGDSTIQPLQIDSILGKNIPDKTEGCIASEGSSVGGTAECADGFGQRKDEVVIYGGRDFDKMLRKSLGKDGSGFVDRFVESEALGKASEDEIQLWKAQLLDDGEVMGGRISTRVDDKNGMATETTNLLAGHSHRPLTALMAIRGLFCLLVLVSTSFTLLVFLAPIGFGLARFFSVHLAREISASVFGNWLSMWPILIEKINQTKVIFAGDRVPKGERVLVLCNHRTEVDWMYIWNLAVRKDRIGYVKYMLKSSVRNLPIFGWGFHILEFLFLDRKWEVDEPAIKTYASSFKDRRDPLWLILFPEGTDFTEAKRVKSQHFAKMHGLKKLNNVLLPRSKGFVACLSHLRQSLDAVYDLTIGYNYRCPSFLDNLFGVDPAEVHVHICRIPLAEIPITEDTSSAWLQEIFYKKDQLLDVFRKDGCFPNSGVERDLDIRGYSFTILVMFVVTIMFLTFAFSSNWIKAYVAFSCVYLTIITYINWRPTPFFTRGRS
ncbi:hypothetical protein O6H91_09G013500 [Diphasiastrum complanatum]|uniref:Uncharacterized protein n=1 Tax=Diphasiastrum complanatum TaxID=34168 RepID=A0ACC2CLF0_DIPCM|nr:hypothetical protein O6H91_Y114800 [Diphasiastrum complanatum]KAJ7542823.1 hypothetical protein O6H91_09G013500 [Diphasiastrum complanatum]